MKKYWIVCQIVCVALLTMTGCKLQLTEEWELTGLLFPESAVFDEKRNVIYVANWNEDLFGNPLGKVGGSISIISIKGEILGTLVSGLSRPSGCAMVDEDHLIVAEMTSLAKINVNNKEVKKIPIEGAQMLNDIAINDLGEIYVSDTFANAIYRIVDSQVELFFQNDILDGVNGLYADNHHLLVASFGHLVDAITLSVSDAYMYGIDLSLDKRIERVDDRVGNYAGVASDGFGNYVFSDWRSGDIVLVNILGEVSTILTVKNSIPDFTSAGCADLSFIRSEQMLIIPMSVDGRLLAYKVRYGLD